MQETSKVRKIAFVGDHLPRKCGIATFTSDLLSAVATAHPQSQCFCVSVNDIKGGYDYPEVVRFEIDEQDQSSYLRAADFLNISNVDIVCLQHEFGIYGGPAGSHILAFLRELRMPVVTTLHTVLREPRSDQRRVMQELISLSTRVVVMAERGRQMLQEIYEAPLAKIDLIAHGIPDVGFVDPTYFKDQFGVEGKIVLLTFGLLSPNKGIEYVLKALPQVLAEFPDVVYIVLGATHPNELREHGEAYRVSLELLAKKSRIEKNVIFYNDFVELENLKEFIGAADLYITPYLNEAQITSGTLAYTFGAGKAVVSTPYWHAAELLADDRGVLVPFADAEAMAREVTALLRDDTRRHAMRKNAYRLGRDMVWSNVAQLYMHSFELSRLQGTAPSRKSLLTKTLDRRPRELPALKLNHLLRMTDSTGIFQHANFSIPNFSEGYCTDDNARAFILAVQLGELGEDLEGVRALATTYASFLQHAFEPESRRFHNHLSFDRQWLDEQGSEDSQGRAIWALGTGVGRSPFRSFQLMAGQLFALSLPVVTEFTSPRAWAFGLLGIHEYLRRLGGDSLVNQTRETLLSRLMELLDRNASPDWCWFEQELSYDNAKLAHALILTGRATSQPAVVQRGLETLRWLNEVQISEKGHFLPIGSNGFYKRGGPRANFDQQPIEAQAMVSACLEAYRTTSDVWWYEQAQRAFDWFLGWNDLGLELYSPESGACGDGLHVDRVNRNQGAESTLAFLLSLAEMKLAQNMMTSFKEPIAIGT
ncbi:glycosyltransferase family 4 protein [Paludibaculum fermentans]|uniref:Glycosyltransferase family 4 protein n=1 Tax=Paludibaculum fermentans TaxID=1473598 RepID=A0A7S7NNM4_PALFE|nr:glycosyltransferase family 4 protein [Paludibaculum fermentans]QOY86429.1 glycosyltransferase family 4 protein [Paludibaculum fermentans]